jgi:cytidylate kinase
MLALDAVHVDTTGMPLADVVSRVMSVVSAKLNG